MQNIRELMQYEEENDADNRPDGHFRRTQLKIVHER